MLGYKKGNKKLLTGQIPLHYPGDRVYLDGDPTKNVQDKCARKADLTNLDLTGTTNTTGSTMASGTYFYLNGVLVLAIADIENNATFTSGTNYRNLSNGALNKGSVKVTTNGTSSFRTHLYTLFSRLDVSKVTKNTTFKMGQEVFNIDLITSTRLRFSNSIATANSFSVNTVNVMDTSTVYEAKFNNQTLSYTDHSLDIPEAGMELAIYY